jgi:hypothetical protein
MLYPCFTHASCMLYACFTHALRMPYRCFTVGVSLLNSCSWNVLSIILGCRKVPRALPLRSGGNLQARVARADDFLRRTVSAGRAISQFPQLHNFPIPPLGPADNPQSAISQSPIIKSPGIEIPGLTYCYD